MVTYQVTVIAGLLASINAVPLNINLGAYSPALVVGDGEISFGGGQDVSELMNTLEGAAVNVAADTTQARGAENVEAAGSDVDVSNDAVEVVTPDGENAIAPSATEDPNLADQAAQISAMRGIAKAKEIEPRDPTITEAPRAKRDLAGFDRALLYAEAALTKGPLIELGTGDGGSGVGIIVDNTGGRVGESAAEAGAGGEGAAPVEKRDGEAPRAQRRAKVTTMYVRRGMPDGLSGKLQGRVVEAIPNIGIRSAGRSRSKRDIDDSIDEINLNVEGDQGVTMTFVESGEDED